MVLINILIFEFQKTLKKRTYFKNSNKYTLYIYYSKIDKQFQSNYNNKNNCNPKLKIFIKD